MEKRGKKRFVLLAKIASSKDAKTKEKHLYKILHWLADWGESAGWVQSWVRGTPSPPRCWFQLT